MVPAADFERLWRAAHGCQQRVRVQADNWLLLGLDDDRAAAARRVFRGLADELAEVLGYDVHVAPAGAEDPV